jgi:3-oxoacyl-[acyl-carrier protein] reductase
MTKEVYNILVNCLRPGFIDTPIHNKLGRTSKDKEERIKLIPLKRAGKPEEIAGMILFLISDYGNFTTGEIIAIAGGD